MITIQILEYNDIIKEGDLCRPLDESISYDIIPVNSLSCYAGSPENNLKYVYVEEVLSYWVGKTLAELNTKASVKYEIIRGELPDEFLFYYQDTRKDSGWRSGRYVSGR